MGRHKFVEYFKTERGQLMNCMSCPMLVYEDALEFPAVRDSECVGAKEKPDVPELPEPLPWLDEHTACRPQALDGELRLHVRQILEHLRAKEQRCATCRHIKKWCNCDAELIPDVPDPIKHYEETLLDDVLLLRRRYNALSEVVAALKRREEGDHET